MNNERLEKVKADIEAAKEASRKANENAPLELMLRIFKDAPHHLKQEFKILLLGGTG